MIRNLTILQLCAYKSEFPGAIVDHFIATSRVLKRRNSKMIAVFMERKHWAAILEKEGIIVESIPMNSMFDINSIIKLFHIINKYNVDIIHTHFGRVTVFFAVLAKFFSNGKVKVVQHWRSTPPEQLRINMGENLTIERKIKNSIGPFMWRGLNKFVDYNFVNSRAIHNYLEQKRIANKYKIEFLNNCVDLERFSTSTVQGLRKELNIADNVIVIGSIINFRQEKDPFTILKIASIIAKSEENVKFIIAGGGPMHQELHAFTKQNRIENKVLFIGFRSDINRVIATCDIILLSNYAPGISNSLLESMAMAKPIVTINAGELETIIKNGINGYLVPLGSINIFTNKVKKLIKEKSLATEIGKSAHNTITKEFNIEKWSMKVVETYFKLAYKNVLSK